jgi:hypothetical protein
MFFVQSVDQTINNFRTPVPKNFPLGLDIGHGQEMTAFKFWAYV